MDDSTISPLTVQPVPSSQLNVPAIMQRPSLNLDTVTPSDHVSRLINSNHYKSPSRTIYSDRFIPSRSNSNFALFNISSSSPPLPTNPPASEGGKEDSSSAYAALLRSALFGPHTPDKRDSPGRNIFRFKTETRQSMHSLSPFGHDEDRPGSSHSPVKTPRKVPRSPYKVNFKFCIESGAL